jgi:transposase-like protein
MDGNSLRDICEQLAEEILEEHKDRPGKRWRCPQDLRSRVVSYARVCREQGEAIDDISRRLGIGNSTLARWLRADQKELQAGFRSVSIVPAGDGGGTAAAGEPLRLTTPAGYTVDGLDAQTLAFLLRVVG